MTGTPMVRTRSGVPVVLLAVIVAVAAVLLGGLSGFAAGRAVNAISAWDAPAGPDAPDAPDAPGAPAPCVEDADVPAPSAALPEFDAAFPTGCMRYLQGVTVSQVTQVKSEQYRWECRTETLPEGTSRATKGINCDPNGDWTQPVSIGADYDDETQLTEVTAVCDLGADSPVCRSFHDAVSQMVFSGQPDLQRQAYDWLGEHTDRGESAVFGSVRVEVGLDEGVHITFIPAV